MIMENDGSKDYAAQELFTNMLYLIIRYRIDGFAEPAIVRALEIYSEAFLGDKDRWISIYALTRKKVDEAADLREQLR
jgi:hypothetical protein